MKFSEFENEIILFACNDWGLGHLARSIPVIQKLIQQHNTIYFAGNERQIDVLLQYCPSIIVLQLAGYNLRFSGNGKWTQEILSNALRFRSRIHEEQKQVDTWCQEHPISLVISDHRYGFRSKQVPSVFMTHQVTLPLKGFQQIANFWHTKQLQKFSRIWVLDDEKHTYAGKLSTSKIDLPIAYIGIQSRFHSHSIPSEDFVLAVVSGPEPYAKQLFDEIVKLARKSNQRIICICPNKYDSSNIPSNLEVVPQIPWKEMDQLFYKCSSIISRSGYTTIMDVARLQKNAIYIPTPGQEEQEYLFALHG